VRVGRLQARPRICFPGEVTGNHGLRDDVFQRRQLGSRLPTSPTFSRTAAFEYHPSGGSPIMRETGVTNTVPERRSGAVTAFQLITDAPESPPGATGICS
jgi:hypothetical protein